MRRSAARHWLAVRALLMAYRFVRLANWIIGERAYGLTVFYRDWLFTVGGDAEPKFQDKNGKRITEPSL
jgi:hypothetical protein